MHFLKSGLVVFGALVVTTLGISASDTFSNGTSSLLAQLSGLEQEGACPEGMTEVVVGQTFSCVDTYENAPHTSCPVLETRSDMHTQENINTLECSTVSAVKKKPWTYVTREQAQVLCARAGKRLPSAVEWHTFAMGTVDTADVCNTDTGIVAHTGAHEACVSAAGVYDTVGNVWEWTSDDVIDGVYAGRNLPEEGYVTQVDAGGVATVSSVTPDGMFADDYLWSSNTGAFGMLRGGFYGSEEDAGVYAIQAKIPPTTATVALGFRCVL